MDRHLRAVAIAAAAFLALGACSSGARVAHGSGRPTTATSTDRSPGQSLHGMPPLLDPHDVYAADRPGQLSPPVAGFRSLVYVPNSESNTVDVIDPATYKVVSHFAVGRLPQHVVPSYDLKTVWVTNDLGN